MTSNNTNFFLPLLLPLCLLPACTKPAKVVNCRVPAGYLQLPVFPPTPNADATNYQLATYLYALADDAKFCRSQLRAVSNWQNKRQKQMRLLQKGAKDGQ